MAKKTNQKAEKAKRNREYAKLHKKRPKPFARSPRPSFPKPEFNVTCSGCNVETTVPFQPVEGKPVLCKACFQKSRTA